MKFNDDDFPAENSSIYYDKIDPDIVWKRPAVSVNTESYRLFGRCVVRFSLLLRARAFVENTHSCVVVVFVARQIV